MKKILYILVIVVCFSCSKHYNEDYAVGQNDKENQEMKKEKQIDNSLTEANKIMYEKENERIKSYISRRKLNMQVFSGIYLQETKQGFGKPITDKNIVSLEYESQMLNGEKIASSKQSGDKVFKVKGDINVEEGLLIAIKHLRQNSEAIVIIPSYLACSLNQDGEKINNDYTIIYKIKVAEVK